MMVSCMCTNVWAFFGPLCAFFGAIFSSSWAIFGSFLCHLWASLGYFEGCFGKTLRNRPRMRATKLDTSIQFLGRLCHETGYIYPVSWQKAAKAKKLDRTLQFRVTQSGSISQIFGCDALRKRPYRSIETPWLRFAL